MQALGLVARCVLSHPLHLGSHSRRRCRRVTTMGFFNKNTTSREAPASANEPQAPPEPIFDILVPFRKMQGIFDTKVYEELPLPDFLPKEDLDTVFGVINGNQMKEYVEKYGTNISQKLVMAVAKKAVLGPFSLPFTVASIAVTAQPKSTCLQACLHAVDDYLEKVNEVAAKRQVKTFLVKATVPTNADGSRTKTVQGIRVRWGENWDKMLEQDTPLLETEVEADANEEEKAEEEAAVAAQ